MCGWGGGGCGVGARSTRSLNAVLGWWLGEVGYLFFFQSFLVLCFERSPTPLFTEQNTVERKRVLTLGDERWANRLN